MTRTKDYGNRIYNNIRGKKTFPHIAVWENFMQTHIPEDCCIHHIDENKANNDITNLVCMTKSEHQRWHMSRITQETKNKMSISQSGKSLSEETKRKMSISLTGKNKGKIMSQEQKDKISHTKKGIPWTQARRDAQKKRGK